MALLSVCRRGLNIVVGHSVAVGDQEPSSSVCCRGSEVVGDGRLPSSVTTRPRSLPGDRGLPFCTGFGKNGVRASVGNAEPGRIRRLGRKKPTAGLYLRGETEERLMANPYDPEEQLLADWDRRGGPGRLNRLAARRPRRFAAIGALVLTLALGTGLVFTTVRVGQTWAWAAAAVVLVAGAAAFFAVLHRSARRTSAVIRRWDHVGGGTGRKAAPRETP